MISKEQIREWLSKNYPNIIGSVRMAIGEKKSFDELIHDCIQDLGPKWVSVEDGNPDIGVQVLISCAFGEFREGLVLTAVYHPDEIYRDVISMTPLVITHWMPLPEPPK